MDTLALKSVVVSMKMIFFWGELIDVSAGVKSLHLAFSCSASGSRTPMNGVLVSMFDGHTEGPVIIKFCK